ncbi:MAG: mechanosensitive ion channel family protein [Sulfurospirillaceae bacterium]|jgi:small conductance mechanosensitive channel|nr:mechanosensitive ion channel family protein [Sulfurospirillaceae bacterium]MDD2826396.1 mechanosensitive ion channel family protein [Sulfurospirillaceae bacterium]
MEQEIQNLQKFYTIVIEFLTNYSFQLVGALIIVLIGWFTSKYVFKLLMKFFLKHNFDVTLAKFMAHLARVLVLMAMVVIALGKIGISIAPFIAAIGAISLTAGLALQGSVSNYAAGVLLIISRPFKVGDTIAMANVYGVVEDIKLAYTMLRNEDEELITIPNKRLIGDIMVNSFEYRIVESSVGIGYNNEPKIAISAIKEVLSQHADVSKTNEPIIGIAQFGESSIDLGLRYWVPTKSYFKTQYAINLAIFEALHVKGITIPYPQREIKILQEKM